MFDIQSLRMFNEDVKWSNKFKHLFKEMFEGSKFDIGCLMKMLNGPNKFKHLFNEMFEGLKFDIGCLMRM